MQQVYQPSISQGSRPYLHAGSASRFDVRLQPNTPLELWGGHEMTLNRVGSRFFDQTARTGHQCRVDDIDLFASLGITNLRYPILWERTAPVSNESCDFSWSDERLNRIRALGMRPIVGLLHHGSGPIYTDLLASDFPTEFATFARRVAQRYPWVQDWNPINEPLTTARFSCLYGLWYPHQRSEETCLRALINQVDAVRLAMQEIRTVIPGARLIQTEDLGFCHAPRSLTAEADFENQRRWLTWDLLSGVVVPGHPLWRRIAGYGLEARLLSLAADPCFPDVIGVNHYLTSERFIDNRTELYPGVGHAAEGPFVNVEAVRVLKQGPIGISALLEQAWERYGTVLAVTECHNGCSREEQIRWILEIWDSAQRLRQRNVPVAAVTAWSLLGSYDWNHLVTMDVGDYESGAFDIRSGKPRPTAVARLLRSLSASQEPRLLGLGSAGWWRREERLTYPPPGDLAVEIIRAGTVRRVGERPILITGKTGTLGKAFARACLRRGLPHVLTGREVLLLEDQAGARAAIHRLQPSAVINAAGLVAIDRAEAEPAHCLSSNADGPENLARLCIDYDIPLVTFSSDQVFDGCKGSSYVEGDALNPLNAYGHSKAEADRRVMALGGRTLVVRTAAFFSPYDSYNFAVGALHCINSGRELHAARDQYISPTYVPDLVDAVLDLLIDEETGVWHLANQGRVSWASFAKLLAARANMDGRYVVPVPGAELNGQARRPADVTLTSTRSSMLASLDSAIDRFICAYMRDPALFDAPKAHGR